MSDPSSKGPVLNVLTRTCDRPNRFRRCKESIKAQETSVTIRHFVSIDRPCIYVEADVVIKATGKISPPIPAEHKHHRNAPYNLYVNDLLSAVKDGWIFVLDDDDEFLHEKAVAVLEPYLGNEDNLIVFKFAMGDGRSKKHFIMPKYHGRDLVLNDVPCSCYVYHSKHKGLGLWHGKYSGDYFAASNLAKKLNIVWVDEVLAGTQIGPGAGSSESGRYRPWTPRSVTERKAGTFVSIVIPVLDQVEYTRAILKNIKETVKIPHEVVIIDNGSTDETSQILDEAGVKVIRNKHNLGWSVSLNQGAAIARGTHIAFLNNDLVLPEGWLETLLAHKEHVICPTYDQGENIRKDFASYNKSLADKFPEVKVAERPGFHPKGFAGFIFMLSREAWERVGPFDESMRYWYGDNDYWLRLKDMGYVPFMSNNVLIHHYMSKTCNARPDFVKQRERDGKRFLEKWA
jgi:GT2 family glycosyltransferase